MSATVRDVISELERAGMAGDHPPGEKGAASVCPLCVCEMVWMEGWPGWVCDSGCDASRIAGEVFSRGGEPPEPDALAEPSLNGRGPFPLLSFEDLLAQPDLEYLIEGLVPAAGLSVIYGQKGTFK